MKEALKRCYSYEELNKIAEGLLEFYYEKSNRKYKGYVEIEKFITEFLKLRIEYVSFAGEDTDTLGFLADGKTAISIYSDKQIVSAVFPCSTIVLDNRLLSSKENGRRRFTLAHEAAHFILLRLFSTESDSIFLMGFAAERKYSREEIALLLSSAETQANALAAALLMPEELVKRTLRKLGLPCPVRVYNHEVFTMNDKFKLRQAADSLQVSVSAFIIRLQELKLLINHNFSEFIESELRLGGE